MGYSGAPGDHSSAPPSGPPLTVYMYMLTKSSDMLEPWRRASEDDVIDVQEQVSYGGILLV